MWHFHPPQPPSSSSSSSWSWWTQHVLLIVTCSSLVIILVWDSLLSIFISRVPHSIILSPDLIKDKHVQKIWIHKLHQTTQFGIPSPVKSDLGSVFLISKGKETNCLGENCRNSLRYFSRTMSSPSCETVSCSSEWRKFRLMRICWAMYFLFCELFFAKIKVRHSSPIIIRNFYLFSTTQVLTNPHEESFE